MALFKYVVAERVSVFKDGLIRFSQPSALNDPWEMRPHIERLMSDEVLETEIVRPTRERPHEELIDSFVDILEDNFKSLGLPEISREKIKEQVVEADKQFPGELQGLYEGALAQAADLMKGAFPMTIPRIPAAIDNALGLLSLTERPDHPLMWSHYANNHTGLVIAFDETHEYFTAKRSEFDEVGGLHRIKYSTERPSFDVLLDPASLDEPWPWLEKLFFTKSKEWEYEQEWRMIKSLKEAAKVIKNPAGNIYLYELPPTCLTGIVLGQNMSTNTRSEIIDFIRGDVRYRHVGISEAVSSSKSYKLEIRPVQ